ncbi:hypothetical protein P8452_34318 [Trifolium repens]|nr:hypothetical protein P8452_34318 [Trifolium repens]
MSHEQVMEVTSQLNMEFDNEDQSSNMPLPKKLKSLSHSLFDELKVHHQQLVTQTGNWLFNFVNNDGEDDGDDDFEEMTNEVDGDEKMEKASNDYDFEDDDNDGDD